ncbi:MAG: hypothetical protein HKN09_11130 [Saprospiraceae bacterium]|nr:hypothetical protein [Saprospiraceae bacterium]
MYKLLTQKGQLYALLLGILCIAIGMGSIIGGINGAGYSTSDDLNQIMKNNESASFDFFNPAISIVLVLILIALVAWIAFSLYALISDPKGSLKFLIGIAIMLIFFFILYSTSDAESTGRIGQLVQRFNVNDTVSKLISGGVKTAVFGISAGFLGAVVLEIYNLFK